MTAFVNAMSNRPPNEQLRLLLAPAPPPHRPLVPARPIPHALIEETRTTSLRKLDGVVLALHEIGHELRKLPQTIAELDNVLAVLDSAEVEEEPKQNLLHLGTEDIFK